MISCKSWGTSQAIKGHKCSDLHFFGLWEKLDDLVELTLAWECEQANSTQKGQFGFCFLSIWKSLSNQLCNFVMITKIPELGIEKSV